MTKRDPFKYIKTSEEIIRLAVMMYVRFLQLLRNVEDLLHEPGVDISHENCPDLVASVRAELRRRDPQTAR